MPDRVEIDLDEICTSKDMQATIAELTTEIASRAADIADEAVPAKAGQPKADYGTDQTVGTDRVRGHVWARNSTALHAENKIAPLMQIVANDGAHSGSDTGPTYTLGAK